MAKAIDLLEKECTKLRLTINKDKSGLMVLSNSYITISKFQNQELRGFRYVENYRYLGTIINPKINASNHILSVRPRFDRICACLTIFRLRGSLQFNSNLFRLYIQPHFRLLAQLFEFVNNKERKMIINLYKTYWKKMTCLPRSTPN
jgi:hypothetical protein